MTEIEELQRRIFLKWQLVGETKKEIKALEREVEKIKTEKR